MTMPEGWRWSSLDEVVTLQRGFDLPHSHRVAGEVPVISAGMTEGSHNVATVQGPGFAIGRATNLGRPTWSDIDFWPLNTTLFARDFHGNEPKFLFHLFESLDLSGFDSGSVQPMLNRNYIGQIKVLVPPLREQRAIAEVLGTLDDKIAANSKLITTTDELARAVYLANQAGVARLTSLAAFVNGRNFTKDATGTGRVVIRIAELNSGIGNSTVYNDIEVADDNVARPGDILFAWSGSLTVRRWTMPEAMVNQHIFKVIPTNDAPRWLVYQALVTKLAEFRSIAADKATTMGHIQRRHLEVDVPVPTPAQRAAIDGLMGGLWDRAIATDQESQTLTELRDTLLPALMDGTIRVKDAVAQTEEVL